VSTVPFTDGGADGLWTVAPFGDPDRWADPTIWDGAQSVAAPTAIAGVADQPRYIVEHVSTVLRDENAYLLSDPYAGSSSDRIEIFRVTARGVGGSENANVLLQTTYGRILE
jgi:type IV pilus assembly protein PilX